jgi:hypothetical protein
VIVYPVTDSSVSTTSPLGYAVETFLRREDAERFIEAVMRDDPELARNLRIEERELSASGPNWDSERAALRDDNSGDLLTPNYVFGCRPAADGPAHRYASRDTGSAAVANTL